MKAWMETIARKGIPQRGTLGRNLIGICKTIRLRAQQRQTPWREELARMSHGDLGVFVLAKRAAAANEAEDSSAVKGNAVAAIFF